MPTSELPNLPRRKRGPKPKAPDSLRVHTVSVRLNPAELAELDSARTGVKMQRGEYLRNASIGKLPPTVPEINQEAWTNLARVAGNLNQYQQRINEGLATGHPAEVIDELRDCVKSLRRELLGIRADDADDEASYET
jgi:hypothetical protein